MITPTKERSVRTLALELSKKHYYIFRVECEKCKRIFTFKIDFHFYLDPEWLIKSVPVKNLCERCKIVAVVKDIRKKISDDKEVSGKS